MSPVSSLSEVRWGSRVTLSERWIWGSSEAFWRANRKTFRIPRTVQENCSFCESWETSPRYIQMCSTYTSVSFLRKESLLRQRSREAEGATWGYQRRYPESVSNPGEQPGFELNLWWGQTSPQAKDHMKLVCPLFWYLQNSVWMDAVDGLS